MTNQIDHEFNDVRELFENGHSPEAMYGAARMLEGLLTDTEGPENSGEGEYLTTPETGEREAMVLYDHGNSVEIAMTDGTYVDTGKSIFRNSGEGAIKPVDRTPVIDALAMPHPDHGFDETLINIGYYSEDVEDVAQGLAEEITDKYGVDTKISFEDGSLRDDNYEGFQVFAAPLSGSNNGIVDYV